MIEIKLSQGKTALIDKIDLPLVTKHNWHCVKTHTVGKLYAGTNVRLTNGKQYSQKMHRLILGVPKGEKIFVDHINGNGLDNRRNNLRLVTHSENNRNRSINRNNKTGYNGVYLDIQTGKYKSQINAYGKRYHLGYFKTAKKAYEAREKAEQRLKWKL